MNTTTTTTTTIDTASLAVTLQALKAAGISIGAASRKISNLARRLFVLFTECDSAESRESFNAELQVTFASLAIDAKNVIINNCKQCSMGGRIDPLSSFRKDGKYVAYSAAKGVLAFAWRAVPADVAEPTESAKVADSAQSAQSAESAESAAKLRASIEKPLNSKISDLEVKLSKMSHALDTARSERDAAKAEATRLRSELNAAQKSLAKSNARADSAERTLASLKAKPTAVAV